MGTLPGVPVLLELGNLLSRRFNVNEFSMNHFYKNRLVRCYLGASHGSNREPNPFTGFDPQDDIPLRKLGPAREHDAPYAIINCALNLNHGSEFAWQERKAARSSSHRSSAAIRPRAHKAKGMCPPIR